MRRRPPLPPLFLLLLLLLLLTPTPSTSATFENRVQSSRCKITDLELYDAQTNRPVNPIPTTPNAKVCIDNLDRISIRAYAPKDCTITFYWRGGLFGWDKEEPYFLNKDLKGDVYGVAVSKIEGSGRLCVEPLVGVGICNDVTFTRCNNNDEVVSGDIEFKIMEVPGGTPRKIVPGTSICVDDFKDGKYTVVAEASVDVDKIEFSTRGYEFTDTSKPFAIAPDGKAWDFKPRDAVTEIFATATTPDGGTFTRSATINYKCSSSSPVVALKSTPTPTKAKKTPEKEKPKEKEPSDSPTPKPTKVKTTPEPKPSKTDSTPKASTSPFPNPFVIPIFSGGSKPEPSNAKASPSPQTAPKKPKSPFIVPPKLPDPTPVAPSPFPVVVASPDVDRGQYLSDLF